MIYAVEAGAHGHFISTQAFTGAAPFADRPPQMIVYLLLSGSRPLRPTHPTLTNSLWELMQRCWDKEPGPRPKISEVLQALLTPSASHLF